MKKILLAQGLFLLFALSLSAQVKVSKRSVKQAATVQTQLYKLNDQQVEEMVLIQEQRLTNLAAIESLRQSDYERYLQKVQSIRRYVEQTTRRILTDQQLTIFEQQQQQRVAARQRVLRELKSRQRSPEEQKLALLRLEEEWLKNSF